MSYMLWSLCLKYQYLCVNIGEKKYLAPGPLIGQIWCLPHRVAMTTSRGETCCAEPSVPVIHGVVSKQTYSSGSEKRKTR